MKVTKIEASVRYSQDTGKGAWKSIELGAEADVAPGENWQEAQTELYHKVTGQLRSLWANGNGQQPQQADATAATASGNGQQPTQRPPAPAKGATATTAPAQGNPEHWCAVHRTEFKKQSNQRGSWYSHKAPDGTWCKEQ